MPEKKHFEIEWTELSLEDTVQIKKYLESNFSSKEIDNFYRLLQVFESSVAVFPKIYPVFNIKQKIRRAVLAKPFSVFYRFSKRKIQIVAVLDNRRNLKKALRSRY